MSWRTLFLGLAVTCGCTTAATPGGSSSSSGAPDASATDSGAGAADAGNSLDAGRGDAGVRGDAGGARADAGVSVDVDQDGIPDADEDRMAHEYFPYLSLAPNDGCPTLGVVYRAAPHPNRSAWVMIWYSALYDSDCGVTRHAGDNEAFGVAADPSVRGAGGIRVVRAISHQSTVCEVVSTCGTCSGLDACAFAARNGENVPVVFHSVNKHGGYVSEQRCDLSVVCDLGGCTLNGTPANPPLVNMGEPGHPLVNNLTTQGFIRSENGWTNMELFNFDPWSSEDFGGAGNVAGDVVDPALVVDVTGC